MRIKSLELVNDPKIKNLKLDFTVVQDTIIFAGNNGCGKTTILDNIYSLINHNIVSNSERESGLIKSIIILNNEEIEIDKKLSDIINIGIEYYDKTNGLFNIASGNLTGIWKEYINKCDSLPSNKELDVNININDIKLDNNKYTKYNDIKLDLGGIAKGYVTELVGNYLEDNNINNYIINAGGNVKVGKAYNKEYYVVGITNPDNTSNIFTKVNVNNLSIVTSGNYQRYCDIDNIRYSHIINPITKNPSNYTKSVTVITSSSLLADIYSTYLYLLPVDKGLEVVNNNSDIEAIWYIDKDNIVRSDNFNYE